MKLVTQDKIITFLIENTITRFRVPQRLIIDNEKKFKGNDMKAFCKKIHIGQTFSSVYYSQGNDQVEASNKIIKSIWKKHGIDTNHIGMNSYLMYFRHT